MPGHDGGMEVTVRPAALEDGADDLLYLSARRYYDAYAGGEAGRAADAAPRAPPSRPPGERLAVPRRRGGRAGRRRDRAASRPARPRRWRGASSVSPRRASRRGAGRGCVRHLNAASGMSPSAGRWARGTSTRSRWPRTRAARASPARCSPTPRRSRASRARPASRSTPGSRTPPPAASTRPAASSSATSAARRDERAARAIGGAGFVGFFKPL